MEVVGNVNPIKLKPLSERNAEIAAEALASLTEKVHHALDVVALQQKTLSMLVEKVGVLEQLLNVQKMQLTGLGPSVKG